MLKTHFSRLELVFDADYEYRGYKSRKTTPDPISARLCFFRFLPKNQKPQPTSSPNPVRIGFMRFLTSIFWSRKVGFKQNFQFLSGFRGGKHDFRTSYKSEMRSVQQVGTFFRSSCTSILKIHQQSNKNYRKTKMYK